MLSPRARSFPLPLWGGLGRGVATPTDPWATPSSPPHKGRAIAYGDRSLALVSLRVVMAGLVPAIHVVRHAEIHVDARDKPGHDGVTNRQNCPSGEPRISICDSPAHNGEGASRGCPPHEDSSSKPKLSPLDARSRPASPPTILPPGLLRDPAHGAIAPGLRELGRHPR
ncbi:protein of unknown function [Bradyrhizobium sp. ORS 285]|nr:protein of unknown function [Bradyrhizobium sp. ORS 285]